MATLRAPRTPLAAAKPLPPDPAARRPRPPAPPTVGSPRWTRRSYRSLVARRQCVAHRSRREDGRPSLAADPDGGAMEEKAPVDPTLMGLSRTVRSRREDDRPSLVADPDGGAIEEKPPFDPTSMALARTERNREEDDRLPLVADPDDAATEEKALVDPTFLALARTERSRKEDDRLLLLADPLDGAIEEKALIDPMLLALGRTEHSGDLRGEREEAEESDSIVHEKMKEPNGNDKVSVSGILDAIVEEVTDSSTILDSIVEEAEGNKEDLVSSSVFLDIEEKAEYTDELEQPQARTTRSIVFVSSEAAPYSKTGGLGDVCGSLPIALAARGHRVMVVSPRYLNGVLDKNFANAVDVRVRIKIPCFGGEHEVAFFHEYRAGVDWVFIDHPSYRRPGSPYGDSNGTFEDNQFRFTILCYGACEAPLVLPLGGYTYGEKSLFLVNDWHASLVPVLLAAKYRPHGVYKDARSILVIHNLSHQGVEPATTYENLGLPPEWYGALEWIFPTWARKHALDKGEAVNVLKGAIVTTDRIVAVSQGYSWEITTIEGGHGLDELLNGRKFVLNGITNGIDTNEWNPASDKHIPFHYFVDDLSGKAKCKAALQKELGLPVRLDCPLIGFIGRLDYQKGTDLISSMLPDLLQDDVQFIMLGSGDSETEDWMRWTESVYREKFRGWVGFNIPVSHRITAGCDILLMPSRFEPCGLNQLYAMRYGTVPVVNCTGGLRDTVENFNPYANDGRGEGTGWRFSPLSKESMLWGLRVAIQTFTKHKASWEGLMKRGMLKDFTWESAAIQYEQIFDWAFIDPPYIR